MVEEFMIMRDGFSLATTKFDIENPIGVVQLVHGAKEHRKRYYGFCEYLNSIGFSAIISDNRGHGESISSQIPLGHMNNFDEIVEDLREVNAYVRKEYPNLPIYMFGHSLGSVFARCYIEKYDDTIEKLILSGTVNYRKEVVLGLFIGKLIAVFKDSKSYSRIISKLGEWDDDSWINSDSNVMKKIRKDSLCVGYKYTIGGMYTIWKGDYELHQYSNFNCSNKNLPILSITGREDPIAGGMSGLLDSVNSLKRVGYTSVSYKVYDGFKHELTNCKGNEHILEDIKNFFTKN